MGVREEGWDWVGVWKRSGWWMEETEREEYREILDEDIEMN